MIDPGGVIKETGEATRTFFNALKDQPLSLALVVMNFVLLGFLFYSGATTADARQENVKMVVAWQEKTDTLMANCVSKEVLESVVGALERQLQEMRRQLDGRELVPLPPARPGQNP